MNDYNDNVFKDGNDDYSLLDRNQSLNSNNSSNGDNNNGKSSHLCFGIKNKSFLISIIANIIFLSFIATVLILYAGQPCNNNEPSVAPCDQFSILANECNFGPAHHAHIILPLANDKETCKSPESEFFFSHGATFFCPHAIDVKFLATIGEDKAREALCDHHFNGIEEKKSSKIVLRQTLPAGALPALAQGRKLSWMMGPMYHINAFGKDINAGSSSGWNLTTINEEDSTVNILRILYSRKLDVEPKPQSLTYLAHAGLNDGEGILSHYISTSGSSGFAHILKIKIEKATTIINSFNDDGGEAVSLRKTWATFLTIDNRLDGTTTRLNKNDINIDASLYMYNSKTGIPETLKVKISVVYDYYFGAHDGFVGYTQMCPLDILGNDYPLSPTACSLGL